MMIKFLIMDVDGTLTDGKINISENGELFKSFNIKDGYGIAHILPLFSIVPIIITGRESEIVTKRSSELGIEFVFQGIKNKIEKLNSFINNYNLNNNTNFSLANCAYIGDDVLDLSCMIPISSQGGIIGCPADAVDEIKKLSNYVCHAKGGEGSVREFIEYITKDIK